MTNKTTAKLTRVNILLARVDNLTPMARTPAKSKHNPAAKKSTYSAKYSKSIEANDKNAVLIASSDILLMYSLIPFATLAAPEKKKKNVNTCGFKFFYLWREALRLKKILKISLGRPLMICQKKEVSYWNS